MASTDDYRRLAAECLRIAHESENPKDRALLLRMAESWLRLADRTAEREGAREALSVEEQPEEKERRTRDDAIDPRGTDGS